MPRTLIITEADDGRNLYIWELQSSTVDASFNSRFQDSVGPDGRLIFDRFRTVEFEINVAGYGQQTVIRDGDLADYMRRRGARDEHPHRTEIPGQLELGQ